MITDAGGVFTSPSRRPLLKDAAMTRKTYNIERIKAYGDCLSHTSNSRTGLMSWAISRCALLYVTLPLANEAQIVNKRCRQRRQVGSSTTVLSDVRRDQTTPITVLWLRTAFRITYLCGRHAPHLARCRDRDLISMV